MEVRSGAGKVIWGFKLGSVVLLLGDTGSQNQVPVPKEKNFR